MTTGSSGVVDCWISRQERPRSDGPFVVKHRQHRSCKLEDLSRRVEAARERLMELTLPARNIGSALEKIVGDFCIGLSRRHYRMERYAAPFKNRSYTSVFLLVDFLNHNQKMGNLI